MVARITRSVLRTALLRHEGIGIPCVVRFRVSVKKNNVKSRNFVLDTLQITYMYFSTTFVSIVNKCSRQCLQVKPCYLKEPWTRKRLSNEIEKRRKESAAKKYLIRIHNLP